MKKIIVITVVLIGIPFLLVNNINYQEGSIESELVELNYASFINVRVKRVNKDRIDNVKLEDYVVGVVAGEMPVSFDIEALKAQAVASRSYVLKKIYDNNGGSYDVVDTTSNQVYLDLDDLKKNWGDSYVDYLNKIRKAVNDTSMEYLEYDGNIANTMFFSTSNGYTEDCAVVFSVDVPYLRSVDSKWDRNVNSNFSYTKVFDIKDFYGKLGLEYRSKIDIVILDRSKSNRIIKLKINGVEMSARDIYNKLGIRSTDFDMVQDKDKVIVSTKGFGHGVGMSQYGALGMARDGYNYKEILSHYYNGTNLKKYKI